MSARQLLSEILQLLREQVDHVVKGEHQQLLKGAHRHEQLVAELENADLDGSAEELRAIYEQIEVEKIKLQSLLESESTRVDFMLRMLLGSRKPKTVGYPSLNQRGEGKPGILNRRT